MSELVRRTLYRPLPHSCMACLRCESLWHGVVRKRLEPKLPIRQLRQQREVLCCRPRYVGCCLLRRCELLLFSAARAVMHASTVPVQPPSRPEGSNGLRHCSPTAPAPRRIAAVRLLRQAGWCAAPPTGPAAVHVERANFLTVLAAVYQSIGAALISSMQRRGVRCDAATAAARPVRCHLLRCTC